MKLFKYVLIVMSLTLPTLSIAQDIEVIIYQTTKYEPVGTPEIILDFKIVNISPIEQTIFEVRTINNLPIGWSSSMCFGELCYAPQVDSIATTPDFGVQPLQPGDTLDTSLHIFTDQVTIATAYVQLQIGTFQHPEDRIVLDLVGTTDPTGIQQIVIVSPNGGEVWLANSTQQIIWQSNGIDSVKIEYSINGGSSWIIIVDSIPSTGNYFWNIPATSSYNCLVQISDVANPSAADWSDGLFSIIQPSITVSSPNGGEEWFTGSVQNISWNSTDVENVTIQYSTNSGVAWITIISSMPNNGIYSWTVPNTPSTNCIVKIIDASYFFISDESDSIFSILQPTMTVISPNGGENWPLGTTQNINWTSFNVTSLIIEYTTDNGSTWIQIEPSVPASNGSYTWIIPYTISPLCRVRITDIINPTNYDMSDDVFSITPIPSITIIHPNGGETFDGTTSELINYDSYGVDSIMVEFSSDAGISWILAYPSLPATGNNVWRIPNISSEDCVIKLIDIQDSNTFDISDNVFSISEVGWYKQYSNTNNQLYSIDMWDDMVGYASGSNGIIIKTINGGETWESMSTGISEDLNSINFISENTGWVAGNNGRILQTTTGGLNWNYQISGVTSKLNSVYFINQEVGWIVGGGGVIRKTTDSGINWTAQQSNITNPLLSVYFYSSNLGWIVGTSGTYLKTTNGGTTWIQKTTGTNGNLYSVLFINDSTGFLVGENGTILRCDDSGEIWTTVLSGGSTWNSVSFSTPEIGYVVGTFGKNIYKTTDRGFNWFRIGSGLQAGEELYEVDFIDINTGWAVGYNGTIIKTVTGSSGFATTTLIANASASNQTIEVSTTEGFTVGDNILINPGGVTQETNKIIGFGSILLELPLQYDHQIGELVINLKATTVEEEIIDELPTEYTLLHNYPNPFNPSTKIRYSIPQLSNVEIKIFDVLGKEIETLINEEKPTGTYEITWYPEGLPSGVYFYQLKAEDFIQTKKMILLK